MYYLITMIKQKKIAFTLKLFQSTGGKKESKSKLKYDPKQQNWKKKDGGMEGFKKKSINAMLVNKIRCCMAKLTLSTLGI